MINTLFSQAVDQTFTQLEQPLKDEIKEKVSAHMIEFLKEKVYQNDPQGLAVLNEVSQGGSDLVKRSEMYGKEIMKKLTSLRKEDQEGINKEINGELTRVMHQLYQAYV